MQYQKEYHYNCYLDDIIDTVHLSISIVAHLLVIATLYSVRKIKFKYIQLAIFCNDIILHAYSYTRNCHIII